MPNIPLDIYKKLECHSQVIGNVLGIKTVISSYSFECTFWYRVSFCTASKGYRICMPSLAICQ